MGYKYIQSSLPITGVIPKNQYTNLFQETLNQQFYNAQNWYTINEETSRGSREYEQIDVRIAHLINAETGLKLGDDWKTLLFKEIDHNIQIGKLYTFDDNVWITINTESLKNLTGTCAVKRCNNTLRWLDEITGEYYEEPCSIEYLVKEPRDYATSGSPFITPGGFVNIRVQFNERTNKIRQNQRFLFGNEGHWTGYKVIGTGINTFNNLKTYDNLSNGVLILDMIANYVNEESDDLVNGIADVGDNVYSITINPSIVEAQLNSDFQLSTTILYNGKTITDREVIWTSSDKKIAIVDSTGLVTMKKVGTCIITANIKNNPVSDTCQIIVNDYPSVTSEVVITPPFNYIYEFNQRTYSVYLYENGVQQTDIFTITCDPNDVTSEYYSFQQTDGNHFVILNKKKNLTSNLTINCVSGSYSKSFDINLKGGW